MHDSSARVVHESAIGTQVEVHEIGGARDGCTSTSGAVGCTSTNGARV